MFATDGIVEGIILVADAGKAANGVPEEIELFAAMPVGGKEAEPSQAEVRRCHEVRSSIGLSDGKRQQSPEVEFVVGRESVQGTDAGGRGPAIPLRVGVEVPRFVEQLRREAL